MTPQRRRRWRPSELFWAALLLLATAVLLRAGLPGRPAAPPADEPARAEVEGKVTLNGQPLGDVEVVFLPEPGHGIRCPRAACYTDAQGRYRIGPEADARDGATAAGFYRVCVTDITALAVPSALFGLRKPVLPSTPAPARVPTVYASAATTPLRLELRPGPQTIDLDLTPHPPEKAAP